MEQWDVEQPAVPLATIPNTSLYVHLHDVDSIVSIYTDNARPTGEAPLTHTNTELSMQRFWNRPLAYLLAAALALGIATTGCGGDEKPGGEMTEEMAEGNPDFPTPPTSITDSLAIVPPDMTGIPSQSTADLYSWLAFIALNWPADASTCGPDTTGGTTILNGTGPVVWETYLTDDQVFVPSGQQPAAWCNQTSADAFTAMKSRLPAAVLALSEKTGVRRFLHQSAKTTSRLLKSTALLGSADGSIQGIDEAVGGVLTDQNGRFVRYEVRMNYDEYNYLKTNNLWNKAGQAAYNQPINFPTTPTGAIEVKAAWKVLGAGDDSSTFYTIKAIVYNDATGEPSPGPNPVTLGLVGLHIIHKTEKQTRWLWSTFEHVGNTTKSFNNPNCPQTPPYTAGAKAPCTDSCCPPNTQTAARQGSKGYVELDASGNPLNKPVQVTRVAAIEQNAVTLNAVFQKLLKGSVWANYELIGTQWMGEFGGVDPKPAYLANTVIETFNQGPVPPTDGKVAYPGKGYQPFSTTVSSSCMKCHAVATRAATPADSSFPVSPTGGNGDFSFILGSAQ